MCSTHSGPENLKNCRPKKLVKSNKSISRNFTLTKMAKNQILLNFHGKYSKKIRKIALFDFTSFFGLDFFKFSGPLCYL